MEKRTVKHCKVYVEPINEQSCLFRDVKEVAETESLLIIKNDTGVFTFRKSEIEFYVSCEETVHVFTKGGE